MKPKAERADREAKAYALALWWVETKNADKNTY